MISASTFCNIGGGKMTQLNYFTQIQFEFARPSIYLVALLEFTRLSRCPDLLILLYFANTLVIKSCHAA